MTKIKKGITLVTVFIFSYYFLLYPIIVEAVSTEGLQLKAYDDVRGKDLSELDLRDQAEILFTLNFDTETKWPSKDKLPTTFDPKKVLEYGKDPGLGVKKLHEMGYNGTGVSVAYIDQPLLEGHESYDNVNLHYYKIRPDEKGMKASMHGPAVLSLLAGKEIGIAPDANVYFFGHPAVIGDPPVADQIVEAESFQKLIEVNKTLSDNNKIKIVGVSHGPDPKQLNSEEYVKAAKEAEENGIMVIDVSTLNYVPITILPFKEKDNELNFEVSNWAKKWEQHVVEGFYVPDSGRTYAVGYKNKENHYEYTQHGGLSWAVPYVVGTIALGLQVDPDLTKEDALKYLYESGHDFHNGKMINPEGFIQLVQKNAINPHDVSLDKDYRYFLYNKDKVTDQDLEAIQTYISRFDKRTENILLDTSSYDSAKSIYLMLKKESAKRTGNLQSIQIFGSSNDVPAFKVDYKFQMSSGIDEMNVKIATDFFYSNFDTDHSTFVDDLSVYKVFKENLTVSFEPKWKVSRLPLTKGEIASYIDKYFDYQQQLGSQKRPIVNFSSPIFAANTHYDDMGAFLNRLKDEYHILEKEDYRLYGNQQGLFPVQTNVLGDFSKENLKAENESGIMDLIINSHGQWNNIDQAVYVQNDDVKNYSDQIRDSNKKENGITELRISLLNNSNINEVLADNYYNMVNWNCSNAYDLNDKNIIHEAMVNGKLINSIGSSTTTSNNGFYNNASLEDMKKNNGFYFFYVYFKSLKAGNSMSDSFYLATKAYSQEILNHTDLLGENNYQFNLLNVLSHHYLGLIEYHTDIVVPLEKLLKDNKTDEGAQSGAQSNPVKIKQYPIYLDIPIKLNKQTEFASFKDDGIKYFPISYRTSLSNKEVLVRQVEAAMDENNVYIKLKYYSPIQTNFGSFLQGDAPGLNKFYPTGAKKGENIAIIKLAKASLKTYTAGLAFNIGEGNFIFVNKDVTEKIIDIPFTKVKVNGNFLSFAVQPTVINGTTLVPLRGIFEELGLNVGWDKKTNTIIGTKDSLEIRLTIGNKQAYKNDKGILLNVPATAISGSTLVPVRFIAESLGAKVDWDGRTRTVIIENNEIN